MSNMYYGVKYASVWNTLLTNVESRPLELSTRDRDALKAYNIHSRQRCCASLIVGLLIFKLRQYPHIRFLWPLTADRAAVAGAVTFYGITACGCARRKVGDFMFPPELVGTSEICEDARAYYKYHAPEDFERLSQKFPKASRSKFEPRDDGYYYFAKVTTKN